MGVELKSINLNRDLEVKPSEARGSGGRAPSALEFLGIYYQNNSFLGMFQLKFCLKTFVHATVL